MGNAVATELFAIAWTVRSSINNVPCYIKGSDCFGTSISAVAVTDAPGKNSIYIVPLVLRIVGQCTLESQAVMRSHAIKSAMKLQGNHSKKRTAF